MKDKEFDQLFRDKLEALQAPYRPEHWQQFEQQLADQQAAGVPQPDERVIDEAALSRLQEFRAPYRPGSWERFTERLDREFLRPEQVLRIKVLELAMFFLLFFTFLEQLPFHQQQPLEQFTGPGAPIVEAPQPESQDVQPLPAEAVKAQEARIAHSSTTSSQALASPSSVKTSRVESNSPKASSVPEIPLANPEAPAAGAGAEISVVPVSPLSAIASPQWPALQAQNPSLGLVPASAPVRHYLLAPADLLASLEPQLILNTYQRAYADLQPVPKPGNVFISMFGSLDYNRILTPSDYFLDIRIKEYDRYELGYSGGISIGFEMERWELQTGLIYSSKHYQPIPLQVISGNLDDGYITEELKDVQLGVIQLPLNLRYNLAPGNRWSVYTLFGASLQVATQANFFVDAEGSFRKNSSSSILQKYIDNGWFQGGSFRDNSYLTANIGLGVERAVSPRWRLFLQPTYQHAIGFFDTGLGPFKDHLNTMSIFSGIRVRLD